MSPEIHRKPIASWRLVIACAWLLALPATDSVADERAPTVGAPGFVSEVMLPGSELIGKPVTDKDSMIVRVVDAFPHGESFRYKIRFQGLEPGTYNLTDWLVRKDGSDIGDLPPIEVEIKSLLPPGQVEPNLVQPGWLPNLGGYRVVASVVAIAWLSGLGYLLLPAKKTVAQQEVVVSRKSLAELLTERLERAVDQASPEHYAELERMLSAMWRRKLGLESLPMAEAMPKIRNDPTAGPLMTQLERWMHSPAGDDHIDLASLLAPYRSMNADELEGEGKA